MVEAGIIDPGLVQIAPGKVLIQAGWDDVPHLDAKTKRELLASTMPHLRDARSKGTPSIGSGAIFPVPVSEIEYDPAKIKVQPWWPKAYGLDVGWNRTAAIWGAHDRASDVIYLYTEHYRGEAPPSVHASAINARGKWMTGEIDPAAHGRGQKDGEALFALYVDIGLKLHNADNDIESGLLEMWERMTTGRLKVNKNCVRWWSEYRLYRRNEKGAIIKKNDHLMDATRYLIISKMKRATLDKATVRVAGNTIGDRAVGY